jgi:hypothetical protein
MLRLALRDTQKEIAEKTRQLNRSNKELEELKEAAQLHAAHGDRKINEEISMYRSV